MANLIYLSPSNHGKNANKCLVKGCYEDKHTRPIAVVCAKYLKASGFDVIIAKTSQNMAARCIESDAKGAALYVPIHTNASSSPSARYLLFMFYRDTASYRKIYDAIAPHFESIYPGKLKAQFWKRTDLYEINRPKAKTIYCELGFHTNKIDCNKFIHNSEALGKALAQGISDYFGVDFKDATPPKKENATPPEGSVTEPVGEKSSNKTESKSLTLNNCPLYISSTAKTPAKRVSGTYYLWSDEVNKGRVRITNSKSRIGVKGQVTGWVDKNNL